MDQLSTLVPIITDIDTSSSWINYQHQYRPSLTLILHLLGSTINISTDHHWHWYFIFLDQLSTSVPTITDIDTSSSWINYPHQYRPSLTLILHLLGSTINISTDHHWHWYFIFLDQLSTLVPTITGIDTLSSWINYQHQYPPSLALILHLLGSTINISTDHHWHWYFIFLDQLSTSVPTITDIDTSSSWINYQHQYRPSLTLILHLLGSTINISTDHHWHWYFIFLDQLSTLVPTITGIDTSSSWINYQHQYGPSLILILHLLGSTINISTDHHWHWYFIFLDQLSTSVPTITGIDTSSSWINYQQQYRPSLALILHLLGSTINISTDHHWHWYFIFLDQLSTSVPTITGIDTSSSWINYQH